MKEIIIYASGTCGHCKAIIKELKEQNIKFETRLINDFKKEWDQISYLTGIPITPTIHYKDSYFVPGRDFNNPQQVINIINEFKKSKFKESRQALEQIKTLNYNISSAFGKLDGILRQIELRINK